MTEGADPSAQRRVGPVQCDGEKIFGSALRKLGVIFVLVHCWMHARRYFERAAKARDTRALVAMALIGKMYDVERLATAEGVSPEERARRRQEQSWPQLKARRLWIEELRPKVPPSTPLGKAIRYVEGRWLSLQGRGAGRARARGSPQKTTFASTEKFAKNSIFAHRACQIRGIVWEPWPR